MILIIDKSKKSADYFSDMFNYMGFLAHIATPIESQKFPEIKYRAVIILNPEIIENYDVLVENIQRKREHVPIFAISDEPISYPELFDKCYPNDHFGSGDLVRDMLQHCYSNNYDLFGKYEMGGINVVAGSDKALYYSEDTKLTKTEIKIMRFYISCYPTPISAKVTLKVLFPDLDSFTSSVLRNHISSINKKIKPFIKKKVVVNIPTKGYVLHTNEIEEMLKKRL